MLGKIIDGRLVVAGRIVKEGNTTITNPTNEKLVELGYKEIEYTEKPTFNKEEEKLTEVYNEEQDKIIVLYAKDMLTDEEHNAVIQAEIVAEENKITPRRQREIDLKLEGALEFAQIRENNIVALRKKFR